jgi:urease accessory protein
VVAALRADGESFIAPAVAGELATVTALDGVLICRYLGPSAARARRWLILAWSLLRPMMLNRPPCPSRFWNT